MNSADSYRHYVEEFALLFEQSGLNRTAGRILGWLHVAEPPHQTMPDLVEKLGASKSSISTATRMLLQMGMIEKLSLPGERRDYYRLVDGVWTNALRDRNHEITLLRELADRGLALLADETAERRQRLQEMRDMFAFFEQEFPRLFARWEEERKGM